MSDNRGSDHSDQHRRKRLRKGTSSCWECKKRKIKCIYTSDRESTCVSCSTKGLECISQEHEYVATTIDGSRDNHGQRLSKIEALLKKLMDRDISHFPPNTQPAQVQVPTTVSLDGDVLAPGPGTANWHDRSAPILTLFDNQVMRFGRDTAPQPPFSRSVSTGKPQLWSKYSVSQKALQQMVPSQEVVDSIATISGALPLLRRFVMPDVPCDDVSQLGTVHNAFSVSAALATDAHPAITARLLLCLIFCLQQSLVAWEWKSAGLPAAPERLREAYVAVVRDHFVCHDELLGTLEGMECLLLQAGVSINDGMLRKSYLELRRAMNVGQLLGLHRNIHQPPIGTDISAQIRSKYLWYYLTKRDAWVCLCLGIPPFSVSSRYKLPFDAIQRLSASEVYVARLSKIGMLILERNESEDASHAFSTTQDIEDQLDQLKRSVPEQWWDCPPADPGSIPPLENLEMFDRVLAQFVHFQYETALHLPWFLRSFTERRYEYSRYACLSAARNVIDRWLVLRRLPPGNFTCKLLDFLAFTCIVMILLGTLNSPSGEKYLTVGNGLMSEHRDLIRSFVETMESTLTSTKDEIGEQIVKAVRTLETIDPTTKCEGPIKLVIPYFGSITISPTETCTGVDASKGSVATSQASLSRSSFSQLGTTALLTPTSMDSSMDSTNTPSGVWDKESRASSHTANNHALLSQLPTPESLPGTQVSFASSQFPAFGLWNGAYGPSQSTWDPSGGFAGGGTAAMNGLAANSHASEQDAGGIEQNFMFGGMLSGDLGGNWMF